MGNPHGLRPTAFGGRPIRLIVRTSALGMLPAVRPSSVLSAR